MNYLIVIFLSVAFADPPNWEDNPGEYEFTATISGCIIIKDGTPIAEADDLFAAFDDSGNVRGLAIQLTAPFGPYEGEIIYEMQLRSNNLGDLITFKYYDKSEDVVLDILEDYKFVINDVLGDIIEPEFYNIGSLAITNDMLTIYYSLEQNYPNPYNPKTSINYTVAELSNVTMKIYDLRGQLIVELVNEQYIPGKYEKIWDSGHLPTGLYFLKMEAYSINAQLLFSDMNKMLYLK